MESLEVRKEYMNWHWEPSTAYPKLRAPENPLFSKFMAASSGKDLVSILLLFLQQKSVHHLWRTIASHWNGSTHQLHKT
ncbi:mCG1032760 [Mus musculus]|nr:mCG1032760 [Mus musculus]